MNKDHIFIIDCWLDTESKENDLIKLIKSLKKYNISILLTGHFPIRPEIQKMVDYYLYDKENPILKHEDYSKYGVNSTRWTETADYRIENTIDFQHDYAIWTTMKNSFNFANYLGKKYIHFMEYDNLPDSYQFQQAFIEQIYNYNAVIYEYRDNSAANSHLRQFCATFIFSIEMRTALNLVSQINTIDEYYTNRPDGWQLERIFLKYLRKLTNKIHVSNYIANDNELNKQGVWERDGMLRNGAKFQIYLAADEYKNLYLHIISGFTDEPADDDYLVEMSYGNFNQFYTLRKDEYYNVEIGKYRKGDRVKVFYKGIEVFNTFLSNDFEKFYEINKITFKNQIDDVKVITNFIDGAYVEILGDKNKTYNVEFINKKTNETEFTINIKNNNWCRCNKKYFVDWRIRITSGTYEYLYDYGCGGKNVLISFESKSLGDTIAWFPYVEEFRKKHKCNVICSTFHNDLFKDQYKEINFVNPGTTVNNLYALYRLGYFYDNDNVDLFKHSADPKLMPLQKVASDILGLDFEEIKPKLNQDEVKKRKIVTIGIHSTAQAKYWNNRKGWQDVTDFLNNAGYQVILLSKEEDGYMGNKTPKGVIRLKSGNIENVITAIKESEAFIGISSGLSWLAWACDIPTIIISGFTNKELEPKNNVIRIVNEDVCHDCWSKTKFNPGDWLWCPFHKGTDRQFECTKKISSMTVINELKTLLNV